MGLYKCTITEQGTRLVYADADPQRITGPKYRWPAMECAFEYPGTLAQATAITQQEYEAFDAITMAADKAEIQPDGADTATVTLTLPAAGGSLQWYVGDELVETDDLTEVNVATVAITADASLTGELLTVTAQHSGWPRLKAQTVYIRVA